MPESYGRDNGKRFYFFRGVKRNAGNNVMGSVRELREHVNGIGWIFRFSKDVLLKGYDGIGC